MKKNVEKEAAQYVKFKSRTEGWAVKDVQKNKEFPCDLILVKKNQKRYVEVKGREKETRDDTPIAPIPISDNVFKKLRRRIGSYWVYLVISPRARRSKSRLIRIPPSIILSNLKPKVIFEIGREAIKEAKKANRR